MLGLFKRKAAQSDVPVRGSHGRFAPSPSTRTRNERYASVKTQLGVYKARTTHDERAFEAAIAMAAVRELYRKERQQARREGR